MQKQITKEQFEVYEKVRSSGVTNMFNISLVCELSCLDRETVMEIIKKYGELMELYPDVRGGK